MSNYAPRLPLTLNERNGFENLQTIISVIHQNLKMLLLTSPGERVMDPNFGVGMKRYMFEQNSPSTHSSIKAKIISQAKEYLPFITIQEVNFDAENNNSLVKSNGLLVTIVFFIDATGGVSELRVEI